ncbi:MAG: type II toxin-antitoxin system HipA family toxin [Rhodoferax sp.]
MNETCTVEIFSQGRWLEVASVGLLGKKESGWRARSYSGYAVEWALSHEGARDAWALSSAFPVSLESLELPHWPVFLVDMLPQGYGRRELLRQLGLPEIREESADWQLLLAGAGNPIGHLRVKEAAQWLKTQTGPQKGFSDAQMAQRSEGFIEHLSSHGLFVAGSSGVQGEWPKILLTRSRDGLLYLDHTVDDADATEHFIVKFGRGPSADLARILRHEAPYMALARVLGLRVHAPLKLLGTALFIPRFDRQIEGGSVLRLAQESIATLTGKVGFEQVPSHNEVCRALVAVVTEPLTEVLEYIKRDVANLALGNKDNHARNTAVQRRFDGHIALTPLYDFAPMYLHPDGIARRIRWEGNDGGAPDWARVLDVVASDCQLDRDQLAQGLNAMAPQLQSVLDVGAALGVEPEVLSSLTPNIRNQADALARL